MSDNEKENAAYFDEKTWDDTDTLGDVRQHLRDNWVDGVECPGCHQLVKVYKRKLDSSMASSLILIYRYFESHPDAQWLHLPRFLMDAKAADRECAKLRYWGLLEEMPPELCEDHPGRTSGLWCITEAGRKFVQGKLAVSKYVWVFNGKVYDPKLFRTDDDPPDPVVTIREALGDRFDYAELMSQV